jgi:hypothetical protein
MRASIAADAPGPPGRETPEMWSNIRWIAMVIVFLAIVYAISREPDVRQSTEPTPPPAAPEAQGGGNRP